MSLDQYCSPVMLAWQLTRGCNLACPHCCTESAPGRSVPGELSRSQALSLARQIIEAEVPYVMLAGGEPTIVPYFFDLAQILGRGGVFLKIETNGQAFTDEEAGRFADLPIRSVQISIDGATQAAFGRMRPGGRLEKAKTACEAVRKAGFPLEITFSPTKLNIHEAEAVIALSARLGAFRFNTGRLMRVGTAARFWGRLEPSSAQYEVFYSMLLRKEAQYAGRMELCFRPFSLAEELIERQHSPSATLLVLPDGRVKVSAALPYVCADLKTMTLRQAWQRYCAAWGSPKLAEALAAAAADGARLARANDWTELEFAGLGQASDKESE